MAKFDLGNTVATRGVYNLMEASLDFNLFVGASLNRHRIGDWGDLCAEDKQLNDASLHDGGRIMSAYEHPEHPDWKIWVITEWDRSTTTILFPSEY